VATHRLNAGCRARRTTWPRFLASELACYVVVPDYDSSTRTSPKRHPVVPPWLMGLIRRTYFTGTDLTSPLASPAHFGRLAEFPPTLIMTAA
jgi:hypothetical protein